MYQLEIYNDKFVGTWERYPLAECLHCFLKKSAYLFDYLMRWLARLMEVPRLQAMTKSPPPPKKTRGAFSWRPPGPSVTTGLEGSLFSLL